MSTYPIVPAENNLQPQTVQPIDQNPAAVYLGSLISDAGRRSQAQVLRVIAGWLGGNIETVRWSRLRYQHTAVLRSRITSSNYSQASVRKFYAAIRGVLHHAWRLGQMSADDYQRAIDLGKVGGDTLPAGRYITPDEFAALIRACIADPVVPAGVRDAAILGVLYFEGLRRSEVISLNTEDYDPDTGRTLIHGKGRKPRIAYLTNGAAAALADWFVVRGVEPGPIFMAIRRWGQVQGGRITSQTIYNMITKRSQEAGIDKISPHDFRRSSVSNMLLAGNDLLIVAKIHGHADPKTTARYDLRPEQQMSVAASSVAMEYERRFPVSVLPVQGESNETCRV